MTPSRRIAVLRGLAGASTAIFVALVGHIAGGGAMPGPLGILIPWMLSFMVCVLLAGRTLSLLRLSLSVGISQVLFHTLFVLGTVAPGGSSSSPSQGAHVHELVLPVASAAAADVGVSGGGAMMWLGHAVAAVLTITALYRGERLLLALRDLAIQAVRWMRRRLDVTVIADRIPVCRVLALADLRVPRIRLLLATLRGRGPPRLLPV